MSRPAVAAGLAAAAALLAGCADPPEEAQPTERTIGNVPRTAPAWEEALRFPEGSDAAWLNLTIEPRVAGGLTDSLGDFEVALVRPDGTVAGREEFGSSDGVGVADFTWGAATPQSERHYPIAAGAWRFRVYAGSDVFVTTEFNALAAERPPTPTA